MTIAENFIQKIQMESESTRKLFARIPEDKLGWRPHAKSMSLGQLAWHIAGNARQIAGMSRNTINEVPNGEFPEAVSVAAIQAEFEDGLNFAIEVIGGYSDADMETSIQFTKDGKDLLAFPRAALIDMILISHWIHHRGQLSVYLRQLDVSLPSIYGPSADELPAFMQEANA